jgi:hypothetical protein
MLRSGLRRSPAAFGARRVCGRWRAGRRSACTGCDGAGGRCEVRGGEEEGGPEGGEEVCVGDEAEGIGGRAGRGYSERSLIREGQLNPTTGREHGREGERLVDKRPFAPHARATASPSILDDPVQTACFAVACVHAGPHHAGRIALTVGSARAATAACCSPRASTASSASPPFMATTGHTSVDAERSDEAVSIKNTDLMSKGCARSARIEFSTCAAGVPRGIEGEQPRVATVVRDREKTAGWRGMRRCHRSRIHVARGVSATGDRLPCSDRPRTPRPFATCRAGGVSGWMILKAGSMARAVRNFCIRG